MALCRPRAAQPVRASENESALMQERTINSIHLQSVCNARGLGATWDDAHSYACGASSGRALQSVATSAAEMNPAVAHHAMAPSHL